MSLTGIPLILVAGFGGLAALVATVRLWSRGGRRRRLVTRTVGTVCVEVLVVVTAGLLINRGQGFYPSWGELVGDGSSAVRTAAPPSTSATDDPRVVEPAGYDGRVDAAYPLIVVLCDSGRLRQVRAAARGTRDAVVMILTPDAAPAATIDELRRGVRVAGHGWALVAEPRLRQVATGLAATDSRFGDDITVAANSDWAAALASAADLLPTPLDPASLP